MKKQCILVFVVILLSFSNKSNAQYTITKDNMPNKYTVEVKANDTLPGPSVSAGLTGANRVWDLSVLNNHVTDSVVFIDPISTPHASKYPDANLAARFNDTTFAYAKITDNYLSLLGQVTPGNNMPMNPPTKIFEFPASYQSSFKDTQNLQFQAAFVDIAGFNPKDTAGNTFDSIRVDFFKEGVNTLDAYGILTTPVKIFPSTMRMKRFSVNIPVLSVYRDSATKQWGPNAFLTDALGIKSDTSTKYEWLSPDYRISVASLEYIGSNTTASRGTYLNDLNRASGINNAKKELSVTTFPNPVSNELHIGVNGTEFVKIEIYSVAGKLIDIINAGQSKQLTINTSSYLPGTYLYKVFDNHKREIKVERFVVSR